MNNLYKYISIVAIVSLFTCCATDIVDVIGSIGKFAGGSGTAYDPYRIRTASHLLNMKEYPSASFILTEDIDLDGTLWIPFDFNGSLKGDNHTIYNITLSPYVTSDNIGFFTVLDGTVKDLKFHNVNIDYPKKNNVGAIAGYVDHGSIYNCHVVLTNANAIRGYDAVGGLIGAVEYNGTINNCSVSSNISSPVIIGNSSVGGAIGMFGTARSNAPEKISDIHVKASIAGLANVGGVIGSYDAWGSDAEKLSYEGVIMGDYCVGGLVGSAGHYIDIYASKANAIIDLQGAGSKIGGLIGYCEFTFIHSCYSLGSIIGEVTNDQWYSDTAFIGVPSSGGAFDCYTLYDYPSTSNYSIYDLVSQFSSPINIAEIMRANGISDEYWDFNRTWTWKGTTNGKTVTAICPKLKWEK